MAAHTFNKVKARVIEAVEYRLTERLGPRLMYLPRFHGPHPVEIAPTASVVNAMFNTSAGSITIGEWAFFGHDVRVLTGTHDPEVFDAERQESCPTSGRDVVIGRGVWVASGAMICGPCVIGEHAVVAAGAVVTRDVEAFTIVGGVPAKVIGVVENRPGQSVG